MNKYIARIYFDEKHPAAFGSYTTLRRFLPKNISNVAIKNFLMEQETYTLHAPALKRFPRDYVFATNVDDQWHLDLADMQKYMSENRGTKFILIAVDVLSKYAFARCLKNKSATVVKTALENIITCSRRKPLSVYADKGLEFRNSTMNSFLRDQNIKIFFAENSDTKACVAERFIRTLKIRLWRYFTYTHSHAYVDVLQNIVNGYNNTYHRSIGTCPSEVTEHNIALVWRRLYSSKLALPGTKARLKVGDTVRVSKMKRAFTKGFEDNYSREIFVVKNVLLKRPVMYELEDLLGERITGRFYEKELQKVKLPEFHQVDKIIKTRGKGARKELYVQWKGYPEKFNSWIRANDLQK